MPSNEQKGNFKSQTPSMRNSLHSGNLLNVVNNKILHHREKSKFGKIVEEVKGPTRRESDGLTPRVTVGRLD